MSGMSSVLIGVTSEPLWEFGEPTDYGNEVYTAGDCWALAWHVAKATNGRLHTLGEQHDWCHVVVEVRPGVFLDANGLHDEDALSKSWFNNPLLPVDDEDKASLRVYTEWLDTDFVYLHGHGEAVEFARLLVNKYL